MGRYWAYSRAKIEEFERQGLLAVINLEDADIGVLITMQEPTKPMRMEALTAGFYESMVGRHPRLQILSVRDLFGGKGIDSPYRYALRDTPIKVTHPERIEQLPLGDADYGYVESAGA